MSFFRWLGLWLRDWRFRRCKVHNIIGPECSHCGWEMRMFNVYLPAWHLGLSRSDRRAIRRRLAPPHLIVKELRQEGTEALHWATVGFDLTMEDHVWLTEKLLGLRMVEAPR